VTQPTLQEYAELGRELVKWWDLVKDASDPGWRRIEHGSSFAHTCEALAARAKSEGGDNWVSVARMAKGEG
jgi:hypothetical protein